MRTGPKNKIKKKGFKLKLKSLKRNPSRVKGGNWFLPINIYYRKNAQTNRKHKYKWFCELKKKIPGNKTK